MNQQDVQTLIVSTRSAMQIAQSIVAQNGVGNNPEVAGYLQAYVNESQLFLTYLNSLLLY